ncbi:MAG: NUDIX hydrolase [Acidimicrobiales bacterium]|nr:NUDIX hydrolase [Acidimicrobiales bacterium]
MRAAGGVVVRPAHGAGVEVLVVHRPKYDDWSLPKGKLDPGETEAACARREVWEETGLRCSLGRELATVEYHDRFGRPKTVRYWEMQVEGGTFEPNREVDEIRWLPPDEAASLLTYPRDGEVVAAALG